MRRLAKIYSALKRQRGAVSNQTLDDIYYNLGNLKERIEALEQRFTEENRFKEEIRDFANISSSSTSVSERSSSNADTSTQLQLPLEEQPKL